MIRLQKRIAATLPALLGCASLFAQTEASSAGPTLTLRDVVRLVGDQNPRVAVEREAVAAAQAERKIAGAFPNPTVALDHFRPAGGGRTLFDGSGQEEISVEIPLLIPGQRASRIAKADAAIAAAQARTAVGIAAVATDAVSSFVRLLAQQERSAILRNSIADVTRLKDAVAGRAQEGAASAYDLARVEVELGVLGSQFEGANSEVAAEAAQLAGLLGITQGLPAAEGTLQPWELPADVFHVDAASSAALQVVAAKKEAAAAEAGITSAQRDRLPGVSLGAGRTWTRRPFGAADSIGLNVEIPIFDTRRGAVDKARSEFRGADARHRIAVAEAEATLRQLTGTVRRRQAALDRYRHDIEPRLARLKEMAADAYALGRHSLLESLDAEQSRREVTLEQIETAAALIDAQIRLLAATGQLQSFISQLEPATGKP